VAEVMKLLEHFWISIFRMTGTEVATETLNIFEKSIRKTSFSDKKSKF
jgi:hypothetical protein